MSFGLTCWLYQAVRSVALELVRKWAVIVEVSDGNKTNGSTAEQPAGRTSQKSEPTSKPSTSSTPSVVSGKKQVAVVADKRTTSAGQSAPRPAAAGGSGFGTMFGKPGASRQPRLEHAPSTMRMNPLPRPEVDDQEDDGGEPSPVSSSGRAPPRNLTPPSAATSKLQPLALPDAKRPAPAPPQATKPDASASSRSGPVSQSAGLKRPLDALRLPTAQVPPAVALAGPGKVEEREERPGLAKRRRRGAGPLGVSWAVQLTDVREYIPNPEEWGRSPRHLHGDDFSDAVRISSSDHIEYPLFTIHLWSVNVLCTRIICDRFVRFFFFQVRQEKLNERGKLSLDDPLLEDDMADPVASPPAHSAGLAFDTTAPTAAAAGGSGRESSGVRLVWSAKSAARADPAAQQRARVARCAPPPLAYLSVSFSVWPIQSERASRSLCSVRFE